MFVCRLSLHLRNQLCPTFGTSLICTTFLQETNSTLLIIISFLREINSTPLILYNNLGEKSVRPPPPKKKGGGGKQPFFFKEKSFYTKKTGQVNLKVGFLISLDFSSEKLWRPERNRETSYQPLLIFWYFSQGMEKTIYISSIYIWMHMNGKRILTKSLFVYEMRYSCFKPRRSVFCDWNKIWKRITAIL